MTDTKNIEFIKTETRDVKWIVDNLKDGFLYVDNSFQRNFVWVTKNQIKLIETILIGFPIPEIYVWISKTNPNTGITEYSIVDGQQRFMSVLDFLNEEFKMDSKYIDFKRSSYANKYFSELSNADKKLIWSYSFTIRIISNKVKKDDIVKMFLRLNSTNTTLNPQELRKAEFRGRFLELADEISKFQFWEDYRIFTIPQIRRMGDIQFISSILIFFRMGIEEETTQSNINKVYDYFNDKYPQAESDKRMFKKILNGLIKLIDDNDESIKFIKRQTHLYTFTIIMYHIIKNNVSIRKSLKDNFNKIAKVNNSGSFRGAGFTTEEKKLFNEYKNLSSQGTQRKTNRIRRFEIMKKLMRLK